MLRSDHREFLHFLAEYPSGGAARIIGQIIEGILYFLVDLPS
jgi:hypothetical protein